MRNLLLQFAKITFTTNEGTFAYEVPSKIKIYRNSILNYIFIPKILNNGNGNKSFQEKLGIYLNAKGEIGCAYSHRYLDLLKTSTYFQGYPSLEQLSSMTNADAKKALDLYFSNQFANDYFQFAAALLCKLDFYTETKKRKLDK